MLWKENAYKSIGETSNGEKTRIPTDTKGFFPYLWRHTTHLKSWQMLRMRGNFNDDDVYGWSRVRWHVARVYHQWHKAIFSSLIFSIQYTHSFLFLWTYQFRPICSNLNLFITQFWKEAAVFIYLSHQNNNICTKQFLSKNKFLCFFFERNL